MSQYAMQWRTFVMEIQKFQVPQQKEIHRVGKFENIYGRFYPRCEKLTAKFKPWQECDFSGWRHLIYCVGTHFRRNINLCFPNNQKMEATDPFETWNPFTKLHGPTSNKTTSLEESICYNKSFKNLVLLGTVRNNWKFSLPRYVRNTVPTRQKEMKCRNMKDFQGHVPLTRI
jgi:hypothetical protein